MPKTPELFFIEIIQRVLDKGLFFLITAAIFIITGL
jgi:hypothetical protein